MASAHKKVNETPERLVDYFVICGLDEEVGELESQQQGIY